VVHLGVASRDRAVADIAAALRSLFLAAVTPRERRAAAISATARSRDATPRCTTPEKELKNQYILILFPGWCILASRRAIGQWLILLLLSVLFSSLLLKRTESSSNISHCPIARRDAKMHHPGKRIKKPVYANKLREYGLSQKKGDE
jgi:plasmid stabilization system protein ParE